MYRAHRKQMFSLSPSDNLYPGQKNAGHCRLIMSPKSFFFFRTSHISQHLSSWAHIHYILNPRNKEEIKITRHQTQAGFISGRWIFLSCQTWFLWLIKLFGTRQPEERCKLLLDFGDAISFIDAQSVFQFFMDLCGLYDWQINDSCGELHSSEEISFLHQQATVQSVLKTFHNIAKVLSFPVF